MADELASEIPRRGVPIIALFALAFCHGYSPTCTTLRDTKTVPRARGTLSHPSRRPSATRAGAPRSLWGGGWQPRDVARIVRRRLASVHLAVAIAGIAGESLAYLGSRAIADQRWLAQLDELGAQPTWTQGQPYLATAGDAVGSTWERTVAGTIEVLALLESLPRLPELIPPPRAWGRDTAGPLPTGIDERLLTRIRALLAKAESTEFPDEAEALTTKARVDEPPRHRRGRAGRRRGRQRPGRSAHRH